MQYPKTMQSTHARWERVPPPDPRVASRLAQGLSSLSLTNGADSEEPASNENEEKDENMDESQDQLDETNSTKQTELDTTQSPFPDVPAPFSRRFAIHDIHYETPPYSNLGIPGPDGDVHDLGTNGLISTANLQHPEFVTPEILDELPSDCKEALLESAASEWEWKEKWGNEGTDAARTTPLKSYAWFP